MSPEDVLNLAKKRVKDSSSGVEWELLYSISLDDLFSAKEGHWKFSRKELFFVQPANTFERVFDADPTELMLDKIISIRQRGSTQYSLAIPPVPIGDPDSQDSEVLTFIPVQRFYELFPNTHRTGTPQYYTELLQNDGTSGMKIGIYYLGAAEKTYGLLGYFKPNAAVDANPIPILPTKYHSMLVDRVTMYAAVEKGMEALANRNERWYKEKLASLILWDSGNPNYRKIRGPITTSSRPKIRFPANFPN